MALPRSVQAQLDAANATLEAINAQPQDPSIELEALAAPETPPAEPAPPPPVSANPPPPSPPPPAPPADDTVWEHKYKSLQGRFNALVPELQNQVKTLQSDLQTAIERLNAAAETKKKPEPVEPTVDPADVETFGADMVDMVKRVAERMFGGVAREMQTQAADLTDRIARLEEALQGTSKAVAATAEERFYDRLAELVPEWEKINVDPAFLAWLGEDDPIHGPRQNALQQAHQALNVNRTAAVFKAFLSTVPQAPKSSAVDKQVSPQASAATTPPAPTNKPILTQKQVTDFYASVRRGEYRSRPDEQRRIEQIINEALAEGRIR